MKTHIAHNVATARRLRRPIPAALGTAGWTQAEVDRARIRTVLRAPPDWRVPATTNVPASTTKPGASGAHIAAPDDIVRKGGHTLDPVQPRAGEQAEMIAKHGISGSGGAPSIPEQHAYFEPPPAAPRLPGFVQAKLKVGAVNDPLEQEADRIAEQVMGMPAPAIAPTFAPPQINRKCAACEEEEKLRRKEAGAAAPATSEAPVSAREALRSPGRPLDAATRAHFEPRFGHDFSRVRVHTDQVAMDAARDLAAQAFTVGEHIVFGKDQYAPAGTNGGHLLAHELAHVVQQRAGVAALQRRADNCPDAPPSPPTIKTMNDFIGLVERVEADAGTKSDPIATARLISRTKYDTRAWDWLLPTTKGKSGVVKRGGDTSRACIPPGKVTADDIGSLCFKLIVSTPDGPIDPMHVIIGIVAGAETLPAGTGATGLSRVVQDLPTSVSQRDVSTWVGDVGKAATEWMAALPQHGGLSDLDNLTKVDYLRESAPPHDLLGDVDGVAMTAKSLPSGFVFDKKASLSDNLRLFSRSARKMRFHIFCSVEGFALEADGVRLTSKTKATIGQRIYDFAMWYSKNDPDVWDWRSRYGDVLDDLWRKRYGNWQWFADQFITFVENGLAAEKAD